jgi:hypothetical protein
MGLPPGKWSPVPTRQDAGWAWEPVWTQRLEEKSSFLCRRSNPDRPVVHFLASHYTDWATPAPGNTVYHSRFRSFQYFAMANTLEMYAWQNYIAFARIWHLTLWDFRLSRWRLHWWKQLGTSETSDYYETKRCHIPEDCRVHGKTCQESLSADRCSNPGPPNYGCDKGNFVMLSETALKLTMRKSSCSAFFETPLSRNAIAAVLFCWFYQLSCSVNGIYNTRAVATGCSSSSIRRCSWYW